MTRTLARLAAFTLCFVAVYAPLETWASWPDLWDPFYLVDLIGMALLAWGAIHARRARGGGPGLMTAGWAWTGANFWRATFGRVESLIAGEQLTHGLAEMCVVACGTALALVCLAISIYLIARAEI